MEQVGQFVLAHFGEIVNALAVLCALLLGIVIVQRWRYRWLLQDAVAFAEQFKEQQLKLGNTAPAGHVLKAMAVEYVKARWKVDPFKVLQDIEVAVHFMKLLPIPMVANAATLIDKGIDALQDAAGCQNDPPALAPGSSPGR